MPEATSAWAGARKIVDTCLGLTSGQELLILFDETTVDVAHIFVEAATHVGVHAAGLYVPVLVQAGLCRDGDLPLTAAGAIRQALGILVCVTDDNKCLPFRDRIFEVGLDNRSKIGHMPGVTLAILPMADIDHQQVRDDCELLASALLKGHHLELITTSVQGEEYRLAMDIGGWERPPAISNGRIERGTWANLPPGEAFVAPIEGSAHGSLLVDGSLPGYVIPAGGEIRLDFEQGRLVAYHSADSRCVDILDGLRDFALASGDGNWSNLAEVGLGVNPAVEPLTGIELLDEKKYGTAHVALGENDWFGGSVSATIHNDLIVRAPTVRVDGRTVIADGQIRTVPADWQEDHRRLQVDPAWRAGFSRLCRSVTRGERSLGLLKREWISGRGDAQYIQVGTAESARKAAYLYSQIPPPGTWTEVASLFTHNPGIDAAEIYQLIRLMQLYELVDLAAPIG